MTRSWMSRALPLLVVLAVGGQTGSALRAQEQSVEQLRAEIAERYSLVDIEGGVALVPRESDAGFRIIEIVDGVVEVDGEALTGQQLGARLGEDADLVLRVTYLSADDQTNLTRPEPEAVQPDIDDQRPRPSVRNGDLVRVGGSIAVNSDELIDGDVVVVMGSATIDGEIDGDVNVVLGSLELGPNALVRRDVTVVGGGLDRAPGARILGSVNEVGIAGPGIDIGWGTGFPNVFGSFWGRVGNVAGTLLRLTLIMLAALASVALGQTTIERIGNRTNTDLVRSGLVGLLAEVLFVPLLVVTIVVLAVSIIGIPLLVLVPFGILAVGVIMFVGFTGLAHQVGRRLTTKSDGGQSAYVAVAVGVLVVMGITLAARLASLAVGPFVAPLAAAGYVVEFVAWTVGFGAALLAWFDSRRVSGERAQPISSGS